MSLVLQSSGGGQITIQEPATASNFTQTLPAATGTVVVTGANSSLVAGTAVASTSGTSIDFTGIPSWVKRVTVMLNGVSTNGSARPRFQVGSSSMSTSGYSGSMVGITAGQSTSGTNGGGSLDGLDIYIFNQSASYAYYGSVVWTLVNSNTWAAQGTIGNSVAGSVGIFGGVSPALGGALDRIRITTSNGTDTFDAGSINILYE